MSRKRAGVLLTDMQRTFCHEYVIDLNGTNAAIRAGYSEDSARSTASHLLDIMDIQEYIRKLQEDKFLKLAITAEQVLNELARIGFADIEDFVPEMELPQEKEDQFRQMSTPAENGQAAPVPPRPRAALSFRKVTVNKITGAKTTVTFNLQQKVAALKILGLHLGLWDKDKRKKDKKDELIVILPDRAIIKNQTPSVP